MLKVKDSQKNVYGKNVYVKNVEQTKRTIEYIVHMSFRCESCISL